MSEALIFYASVILFQKIIILMIHIIHMVPLNLPTLELRRLYYDLDMCYKVDFNIVALEFSEFFTRNTLSTRGHPYKLCKSYPCKYQISFFVCRVVKVWNSLPADIVDFSSLCRFRRNIDFSEFLTVQ